MTTLRLLTPRSLKMAYWTWVWLLTTILVPGKIDAATLSVNGSTSTAVASTTEIRLTCRYTLSANENATRLSWNDPKGTEILTWNINVSPASKSPWTKSASQTTATAMLAPAHVTKTSGGTYTCKLASSSRNVTETTTVTIQYKPTVTLNPTGTYDVNQGSQLLLTCAAQAVPTATIQWMKGSSTLSGTSVNKPKAVRADAGTYKCTATNTMISGTGSATGTVAVTINYLDNPSMAMSVTNTTVKENQRVTITCTVSSVPTATLTISGPSISQTTTSTSASTTFSARCSNTGTYLCRATNAKVQPAKVVTKTLRVLCKPRQGAGSQQNLTKRVSESAIFTANVIADPPPQYTWKIKDPDTGLVRQIQNKSGHVEIINNNLRSSLKVTVENADDYAQYILEVMNVEGETTLNYWLRSQTVPFRVQNLEEANVTTDSITVRWTSAFNGGARQQYHLQYQTTLDRERRVWTQKTARIEDPGRKNLVYATISDIYPGRTYTVRIFSNNTFGNSEYSNSINLTTSVPQQLSVGAGIGIGIAVSIVLVALTVGCLVLYVKVVRPMRDEAQKKTGLKINNPEYDPQSLENPGMSNYANLDKNTREKDSPEMYDDLTGAPVYQNVDHAQNNSPGAASPEVYMNVPSLKENEEEPKHKKEKNKKKKQGKSKDQTEGHVNKAAQEELYANS
ncbi:hemicentin-2-like isoform X2 [Haliotis rubra]|uniref:hemicentin-2-like isoform X2 n=1 Tax=Haliotis rubra TaxID=36100 RepID=UPI001EE57A7C|nr:hemicentin-2-like isoform X2 [Haliotis rubra]